MKSAGGYPCGSEDAFALSDTNTVKAPRCERQPQLATHSFKLCRTRPPRFHDVVPNRRRILVDLEPPSLVHPHLSRAPKRRGAREGDFAMVEEAAPAGEWRAVLEAFALRVANDSTSVTDADAPRFAGLSSRERAAVHDAARRLGLGSRSEGSDEDGTRAVTVYRRAPRGPVAPASAPAGPGSCATASAAAADDDHDDASVSAFEDTLPDLREAPFDAYKTLRIPRSASGGYSGGTARARAAYHREAVRWHPDRMPPGCGACHGCGGALKLGRWMHRHAARRAGAPEDDPEFGIIDDADDDGGDACIASSRAAGSVAARSPPRRRDGEEPGGRRADSIRDDADGRFASAASLRAPTLPSASSARRDLCPPCYARHRPARRVVFTDGGDVALPDVAPDVAGKASETETFVAVSTLDDLGRERARYDAAAYEALRRRRETAAAEAAAANARALAAVSGPEAMRAVEAMEAEKREAEKREARAEEEKRAAALGGGAPGDAGRSASGSGAAASSSSPPGTTRFLDAVTKFQRVTVAYLVLRDPERTRILEQGGWRALVQSESYAEDDVFDADPWEVYDRFFAGEDEEDRQYLLLHGGGGDDSDESDGEGDTKSRESLSDDDDDALVEEALTKARHERFHAPAERAEEDAPLPPPPVSVLATMSDARGPGGGGLSDDEKTVPGLGGGDVWAAMAERFGNGGVGDQKREELPSEEQQQDGEEEEEDEEEEDSEEEDSEEEEEDSEDEEDSEEDEDSEGPPEEVATAKRKREDGAASPEPSAE